MKTNVSIELDDSQRSRLADAIDGKITKRLATRADVNALLQGLIDHLVREPAHGNVEVAYREETSARVRVPAERHQNLDRYSKEIAEGIARRGYNADQEKSYRKGWTVTPFSSK